MSKQQFYNNFNSASLASRERERERERERVKSLRNFDCVKFYNFNKLKALFFGSVFLIVKICKH